MPSDYDPPRRRPRDDEDDDDRPRRRDRDDDDDFDDRPRRRRGGGEGGGEKPNGLATAGLILGLLSFCTLCLTGIPAVICSAIALGKPGGRGAAMAGLILGLLGTLGGVGAGIWGYFQATDKVRLAASRVSDSNNLKQIGMGFFGQEAGTNGMHAPYAPDEAGKPQTGLSWRVGMLPYVEQNSLYRKFDLSQPWDSAKNRPLSDTPIKVYTSPYDGPDPSVNTPYRVFYGGGALFNEDGRPVRIGDISDGTSNTIMVVHAAEQVPWAAPRDFRYSPTGPLPKFGHGVQPGGFMVLMADGSVRNVSHGVSERTMRAAITRAGGDFGGGDW